MPNLRMCPNCRAFVPSSERVCTECHEPLGKPYSQRVASSAALVGLVPPTHFTTLILLLINFALFAATLLMSYQKSGEPFSMDNYVLYYFGAKERTSVFLGGQWWRLVTAGFLHGGFLHILMNSWWLYDLGAQVEQAYGTARFLVIYLLSSAAGFLASCFWTPALSIGASAAVFGLLGSMLAYGYRNRGTAVGFYAKAMYSRWVIFGLIISVIIPRIDVAAHVGGLAAGFVLAYVADTPGPRSIEWLWRAAAGFTVLITVASFLFVWLSFPTAATQ